MTEHADVAIVGGAAMGSAVACFLLDTFGFNGRVVVLERDRSYAHAASARSTSGYRQQFSSSVNVALSRWSAEFLADANVRLALDGRAPGIALSEAGYLYLGGADAIPGFVANHETQRALGVDVALLTPEELMHRFPWLNVDDVAIGSLGLSGEGWFDGYLLMRALADLARARGAGYRQDEVERIERDGDGYRLTTTSGAVLSGTHVVLTAGTRTPALARQLGIDLPVEPVKQSVFTFSSPLQASDMPYLFTPDGLFCRPEGRDFIAGLGVIQDAPAVGVDDMEPDLNLFDAEVWPRLAHRVSAFEEARFRGAWAGHYDYSRFDHNPFVGPVDGLPGLLLACGFSGHGMMQTPGVGYALAELIVHGAYRTLDLSPLAYGRIARGEAVREGIQY